MRIRLISLALFFVASSATADIVSGTITKHHLNGTVMTERGVCVQLSPAASGSGWMCLYKSNALYKETSAMLLSAYLTQIPVTIWSPGLDADGHRLIGTVE